MPAPCQRYYIDYAMPDDAAEAIAGAATPITPAPLHYDVRPRC